MRLINTRTLHLEEFLGEQIPKYAILSHTWIEGEEVTPDELTTRGAPDKSGWFKIEKSARQALKNKLGYIWIDTCCIDKSSSAELSEAINSMMNWYLQSEVCYTYLADVPSGLGQIEQITAFAGSRWFSRGWTLQELLAPPNLVFFFNDWSFFDTRDNLAIEISGITGIDESFLHNRQTTLSNSGLEISYSDTEAANLSFRARLDSASIAQRMSWASRRRTTRVEDTAYCLLGIFGINMPLLYGEGSRAFFRLQEQILMSSDDQSLLAWNFDGYDIKTLKSYESTDWSWYHKNSEFAGVLARSPAGFANCRDISRLSVGKLTPPSSMTNKGLRLELPISESSYPHAFLQCQTKYAPDKILALPLKLTPEGTYVRAQSPLALVNYRLLDSRMAVLYTYPQGEFTPSPKIQEYTVITRYLPQGLSVMDSWSPSACWSPGSSVIIEGDDQDYASKLAVIKLGDRATGKAHSILLVGTRGKYGTQPLASCYLVKYDDMNKYSLDCWERLPRQKLPGNQRDPETVLKKLWSTISKETDPLSQTLWTTKGKYSASIELEDCFGKTVLYVDVSFRPRPFSNVRKLLLEMRKTSRQYVACHRGFKRILWSFFVVPRIFSIVVEFLARLVRKVGTHPLSAFPYWACYLVCYGGHSFPFPKYLSEKYTRSSKNPKRVVGMIVLFYVFCKFIGSEMVLDKFKNTLNTNKTHVQRKSHIRKTNRSGQEEEK